jgi:hypothetical protein
MITHEQTKRILSAIAQCDRYIDKEEARSADLRPADIQKRLDGYKEHRDKLQRALETGSMDELMARWESK